MLRPLLLCVLLVLILGPAIDAHSPPPLPSASPPSSSPLASLLPAVSSVLRDLSAASESEDVSYLRLAKRHFRFVLSALVSPLQLLDWSHWSADPFAFAAHPRPHAEEEDGEWEADEDFALHGDPSHVLRASVNAHRHAAAMRTNHRSQPTPQSFTIPPTVLSSALTGAQLHSNTSGSPVLGHVNGSDSSAGADVCMNHGEAVRFTRWNSYRRRYDETFLCYCPADFRTPTCQARRAYTCRLRLASDAADACAAARVTPEATRYASHSERLSPVHLSPDASDYYTYEPVLSGPAAPCLLLADERAVLDVNFTCHFVDARGADTVQAASFDPARLQQIVSQRYQLNDTLPVFAYTVANAANGTTGGGYTFAQSDRVLLSISARLHNTAHPSQFAQSILPLTAAHLQAAPDAGGRTQPLIVLTNVSALHTNLRRGGRVLLALRWMQLSSGLVVGGSGMPWQLTVEDGTWRLPGPRSRVLLSGWQTAVLSALAVLVAWLLVWRWYQRRQTAMLQALLAEQRGKQQSWYIRTQ